MPSTSSVAAVLSADVVRRAWLRADASRWALSEDEFHVSLQRSVHHRFPSDTAGRGDVEAYLESLFVADLALARACALGRESAWDHFVREFRPVLRRVAGRSAPPETAREVADSLYAELFGLDERDGVRRSLFDYYHGRSALASWLRAVVAQRLVDRARSARRTEPLAQPGEPGEPAVDLPVPDVDRDRLLPAARTALRAAIAGLAPRDRLRLALYYTQDLTLAAIGRVLGESEATASRKLQRTRTDVRRSVERILRDAHGLTEHEVRASFDYARTDPAFDLSRTLPPG